MTIRGLSLQQRLAVPTPQTEVLWGPDAPGKALCPRAGEKVVAGPVRSESPAAFGLRQGTVSTRHVDPTPRQALWVLADAHCGRVGDVSSGHGHWL